ncbi:MAG: ribosome small subunit-dependent GTPase A, partial [Kofleriaceae bacterium]
MTIGWDDAWEAARRVLDPEAALMPVRITAEHRGAYHATADSAPAWVEVPGKVFHAADDKRSLPTVGDWVLVEGWAGAL